MTINNCYLPTEHELCWSLLLFIIVEITRWRRPLYPGLRWINLDVQLCLVTSCIASKTPNTSVHSILKNLLKASMRNRFLYILCGILQNDQWFVRGGGA